MVNVAWPFPSVKTCAGETVTGSFAIYSLIVTGWFIDGEPSPQVKVTVSFVAVQGVGVGLGSGLGVGDVLVRLLNFAINASQLPPLYVPSYAPAVTG